MTRCINRRWIACIITGYSRSILNYSSGSIQNHLTLTSGFRIMFSAKIDFSFRPYFFGGLSCSGLGGFEKTRSPGKAPEEMGFSVFKGWASNSFAIKAPHPSVGLLESGPIHRRDSKTALRSPANSWRLRTSESIRSNGADFGIRTTP